MILVMSECGQHTLSRKIVGLVETWAFITAWNPLPLILSLEENNKRNKELEKEILEKESQIEHITALLLKACEDKDINFLAEGPKQSKEIKKDLDTLYDQLFAKTQIFEEKEKYFKKEIDNLEN